MKNECLIIDRISDTLSKVTMNRPEKHNALSLEMITSLCDEFTKLEKSTCRVVVLNAIGTNFCSGMDLKEASDDSMIEKLGSKLAELFTILHDTSLVTIAAVRGHAIAGGGGLAASCDIILLDEEAKMGFPEVRRGLIAAQVATILSTQISMRHLRELLITGQLIDSHRAVEIGLADHVILQDDVEEAALHLASEILKGGPNAVKETKRLLNALARREFPEDLKLALKAFYAARRSAEAKEGIDSFMQKRPPNWKV